MGYLAVKVPWTLLGVFVAVSLWWDAVICLLQPLFGRNGGGPPVWGLARGIFPGIGDSFPASFIHEVGIFILGAIFLFAAPWVMRGFVNVDRLLIGGPARARSDGRPGCVRWSRPGPSTVDASAATLAPDRARPARRHPGPAGGLGHAARHGQGEARGRPGPRRPRPGARSSSTTAHRGAKEAIAELRDIARGIHPPALDIGLEGALATLAARSAVPTELSVDLQTRPTPAIEAIAYFCVAELLANVAQHAQASRASVSCAQQGTWLRLVVRDDGTGGAQLTTVGSSSSGLAGLTDRVHAVDGRLNLVSPLGGPTVVTVDLPLGTPDGLRPSHRHRRGLRHPARRPGPAARRPGLRHHGRRRGPCRAAELGRPESARRRGHRHQDAADLHRRGPAAWPWSSAPVTRAWASCLFSQYIETRYAADLLADDAAGIGYLLKDRVADVSDFVEALERVAVGGTALDPEVVTQLLGATRRTDSLSGPHRP